MSTKLDRPRAVTPEPDYPYRYTYAVTTFGRLLLVGSAGGLAGIHLAGHRRAPEPGPAWERDDDAFTEVRRQLCEYFSGERQEFDLPLQPEGTDFQKEVWSALREIPYGETASYGEIAERLGKPGAARAVGAANGRNPLPIVVPCHRVIGSNGHMTGFGLGIERKVWLLEHEQGATPLLPLEA